jgi:small subunit ribosomal protein S16
MAVTLRLVRLGRSNRAFFRLRAADSRNATTGRFIEELGHLDPILKDEAKQAVLKKERIEYWLAQGAKVTPTVASLLKKNGIAKPAKTAQPAKK